MSWQRRLASLILILSFALGVVLGCQRSPSPPAPAGSAAAAKPMPSSVAQADEMKRAGAAWSNEEIRAHYNQVVGTIAAANERWKQEGLAVEERARRAFQIRHEARLTARAMMASRLEVELLQKRDQEKYGSPDGPTFDGLVESAKKKGTTGDAIYEGIIQSAQRTDEATNSFFGGKKAP